LFADFNFGIILIEKAKSRWPAVSQIPPLKMAVDESPTRGPFYNSFSPQDAEHAEDFF
jgi:hypothetical protein